MIIGFRRINNLMYHDGVRWPSSACLPAPNRGWENRPALTISDDMPETGGGESAAPEVASDDDDDGGDDDGEPARRSLSSNPSIQPAQRSASQKHSDLDRSRTLRQHQAEKTKSFEVIGVSEFDIAESIGMSVEFLRKDRSGKRLIPFYRIGTSIRYNPTRVTQALATLEEGGQAPRPKAKKLVNTLSAG